MDDDVKRPPRIALVGPCASGKSTLATALESAGYEVRHVAQEHSYVPDMWRRLSRPDLLVYLDLSYEALRARRPTDTGGRGRLADQQERLAHARAHCDFYVDTSNLTPEQVAAAVLAFLGEAGVEEGRP